MTPEERVEYLNGQLFDARRLLDESRATTQKWYDEAHEKRRELRRLEEQLETLRRHDEAATQDAVFFRKGMVDAQKQLEAARHVVEVARIVAKEGALVIDAEFADLDAALIQYDASFPAKRQEGS
jgi:chromosome segregation ATPase